MKSIVTDFKKSKCFFALPLEAKMVAAHPPRPNPHRGYSAVGQENISGISGFEKGVKVAPRVFDIKVGIH